MSLVEMGFSLEPKADHNWIYEFLMEFGGNTRSAYASDLKKFFSFCLEHAVIPQTATRGVCAAFYRHGLEIEGVSTSTASRRLSALRGYYQYGLEEGYIESNPIMGIRRAKTGTHSMPTGVSSDELTRLIEAARNDSIQSLALILLLSKNGLRISEALGVNFEDLGTERGLNVLKVIRKGGKEATIPLNPITAGVIAQLRGERKEGPMFENSAGNRMNRQGAWRLVRKLAKKGAPEKADSLHPHDFRHAFVTMSLDAGASLRDVQDAAAHADPKTTRMYDTARNNLDRHPTFLLS